MNAFFTADYVIGIVTLAAAILGLFGSLVAAVTGAAGSILTVFAANHLLNAGIASAVGPLVFEFLPWEWGTPL